MPDSVTWDLGSVLWLAACGTLVLVPDATANSNRGVGIFWRAPGEHRGGRGIASTNTTTHGTKAWDPYLQS